MDLKARKQVYVQYLLMKVEEQDWHGVSDAANDLRELDIILSREDVAACGPEQPSSSCAPSENVLPSPFSMPGSSPPQEPPEPDAAPLDDGWPP